MIWHIPPRPPPGGRKLKKKRLVKKLRKYNRECAAKAVELLHKQRKENG